MYAETRVVAHILGKMPRIANSSFSLEQQERFNRIAQVLDQLTAMHREVLLLHDADGLTPAEIGRRLGIKESTASTRIYRARAQFMEVWNAAPAIAF